MRSVVKIALRKCMQNWGLVVRLGEVSKRDTRSYICKTVLASIAVVKSALKPLKSIILSRVLTLLQIVEEKIWLQCVITVTLLRVGCLLGNG